MFCWVAIEIDKPASNTKGPGVAELNIAKLKAVQHASSNTKHIAISLPWKCSYGNEAHLM